MVKTLMFLIGAVLFADKSIEKCNLLLNEKDAATLYKISKGHDIAGIVAESIFTFNLLPRESELYVEFQKQQLLSVYRYEKINYELHELSDLLEKEGVNFIPLKGAILRKYYPQPWMRTSCDIDVLIHKDDIDRAIQALCEARYIRQEDSTTHDCSLMSPNGVHLELHYSLEQEGQPTANTLLKSVWEHCSVKDGTEFHYIMSNEMFLFYHIAHMAKHFVRGGCGIRSFIDLWLLNQKMPIETEKLQAMLEQANLFEFYKATSKLATVWMENQPHDTVTKSMEEFVLTGGVYGSAINSASVKAAKGESRLKTFFKLMFLPRKNLEIIYPKLKNRPLLMPFYQVKRWFKIFNKKKRNRVTDLTAARNSVQKETRDGVESMLIELGLK